MSGICNRVKIDILHLDINCIVGKDWRRYDCFAINSNAILVKINSFCIWDYLEIVLVEDSALKACLNERNGLITPRKIVDM